MQPTQPSSQCETAETLGSPEVSTHTVMFSQAPYRPKHPPMSIVSHPNVPYRNLIIIPFLSFCLISLPFSSAPQEKGDHLLPLRGGGDCIPWSWAVPHGHGLYPMVMGCTSRSWAVHHGHGLYLTVMGCTPRSWAVPHVHGLYPTVMGCTSRLHPLYFFHPLSAPSYLHSP